jgi:hypothetical protein
VKEGEQLMTVWRKNHYTDFNSWVQVSKTTLLCDFVENRKWGDDGEKEIV